MFANPIKSHLLFTLKQPFAESAKVGGRKVTSVRVVVVLDDQLYEIWLAGPFDVFQA